MRLKDIHSVLIAVLCTLLFALTIFLIWREYNPPWKQYHKEANHIGISETEGIHQIWLKELDIVDRCTTCHLTEDRKEYSNKPHPFRSHSGDYLRIHPVKRFGCVVCHDGQGEALNVKDAHDGINATRAILRGKSSQASCFKCHPLVQELSLDTELQGAYVLSKGWRVFNEYNCIACHKLKGYKRPEHIAPSLSKVGSKVNKECLLRWLKDPRDYLSETRMPRYRFSNQDIEDIVSYLFNLKDKRFEMPIYFAISNHSLIQHGKILFESLGCLGCHKIGNKGVPFAPDLSAIGDKVKQEWLYQFLMNPRSYDPKTFMPDFKLSEKDLKSLTAYLMSLKKGVEHNLTIIKLTGDKNRGRKLISDYGCLGCHEIEDMRFQYVAPSLDGIGDKRIDELIFGNVKGVKKSLKEWLMLKVGDPGRFTTDGMTMRMPEFKLNKEEVEQLTVFLLGIKKEEPPNVYIKEMFYPYDISQKGKRIVERYNCLGCHKIKDRGGEIGPELTEEGKKSRPEWLYVFLRKPWKIRPEPLFMARMPDFKLSDTDINTIIEYLFYISKEGYPYIFEEKEKVSPNDIMEGEKLYHEIFACIACHRVNGSGGEIGPDHTDIASRLRREWIERWVKEPTSIKKDVRMPVFKFEDWQFKAIVNYLMTLGNQRFVEEVSP